MFDFGVISIGTEWIHQYIGVPHATREVRYEANKLHPNIRLDPSQSIVTWRIGAITDKDLQESLLAHAIDLSDNAFFHALPFREPTRNEDEYGKNVLIAHPGYCDGGNYWDRFLATQTYTPTNDELMVMLNRGLINQRAFYRGIGRNCDVHTGWGKVYDQLRYVIPPISDLISFSVREAFNRDVITKFGYNKELPIEILPWLEKQGLAGGTKFAMPPNSTTTIGPDNREFAQWFDHYWWAHWQLPSLSMGYEMYHRLYATSRYGPSPDVRLPNGQADPELRFEFDELDTLHKTQDYPPFWRRRLAAMSFNPLTRTDVRRMRQVGVFKNPQEVYHAYRAIGYNDTNAERLAQFTEELTKPKNRKVSQQTAKLICQGRMAGLLSEDEAINKLKEMGYSQEDSEAYILSCETETLLKNALKKIGMIRLAYLKGKVNELAAYEMMRSLGLTNDKINGNLLDWKQQRAIKYRDLTVNQLKKAFLNGNINEYELKRRLENLDYSPNDIKLLIEETYDEMSNQLTKETSRGYVYFTPKVILELYNSGIIEKEDIDRILRGRQWADLAIDSFMLKNGIE